MQDNNVSLYQNGEMRSRETSEYQNGATAQQRNQSLSTPSRWGKQNASQSRLESWTSRSVPENVDTIQFDYYGNPLDEPGQAPDDVPAEGFYQPQDQYVNQSDEQFGAFNQDTGRRPFRDACPPPPPPRDSNFENMRPNSRDDAYPSRSQRDSLYSQQEEQESERPVPNSGYAGRVPISEKVDDWE